MKKLIYLLVIFSLAYFLFGCGSLKKFQEPKGEGLLVIGGCVVENNGVNDRFEVIKKFIEVGVVGLNTVDGETKCRPYWSETDDEGYYVLHNVPPGKYNLQGIKVWVAGSIQGTISSRLDGESSGYLWHRQDMGKSIIFGAEVFEPVPEGRVYNLNHDVFIIYNNKQVKHESFYSLDNVQFELGEVYNRPNVIEYFRVKYADTGWAKYLNEPYKIKKEG